MIFSVRSPRSSAGDLFGMLKVTSLKASSNWEMRSGHSRLESPFVGSKETGWLVSYMEIPSKSSIHKIYQMDVSKHRGTPQIIHLNRVFHSKQSILGYPYFWEHLNIQHIMHENPSTFGIYFLETNLAGEPANISRNCFFCLLVNWKMRAAMNPTPVFGIEEDSTWRIIPGLVSGY